MFFLKKHEFHLPCKYQTIFVNTLIPLSDVTFKEKRYRILTFRMIKE